MTGDAPVNGANATIDGDAGDINHYKDYYHVMDIVYKNLCAFRVRPSNGAAPNIRTGRDTSPDDADKHKASYVSVNGWTAPSYPLHVHGSSGSVHDVWNLSAQQTVEGGSGDSTVRFKAAGEGINNRHLHYGSSRDSVGGVSVPLSHPDNNYNQFIFETSNGYRLWLDREETNSDISIKAESGVWATGFYVSSDERIKRDIVPADSSADLDTLRSIQMKRYAYTDGSETDVLGFIAQRVKEVFPAAVKEQEGEAYCGMATEDAVRQEDGNITGSFPSDIELEVGDACTCMIQYKMVAPELAEGDEAPVLDDDGNVSAFEPNVKMTVVSVSDAVAGEDGVETRTVAFQVVDVDVAKRLEDVVQIESLSVRDRTVPDFHTLKKDRLIALNFSATQALAAKVESLEAQVAELRALLTNSTSA